MIYNDKNIYSNNNVQYVQLKEENLVDVRNVQAFINNISVPKSLEELYEFVHERGRFNIEDILASQGNEWTVPRWTKTGDIVFFMHAKYGLSTLTALRTKLINNKQEYDENTYLELYNGIQHGLDLNKKYGGKIFAVGQVVSMPEYIYKECDDVYHWKSRIYANIGKIKILNILVGLYEFNNYINISR